MCIKLEKKPLQGIHLQGLKNKQTNKQTKQSKPHYTKKFDSFFVEIATLIAADSEKITFMTIK